MITVTNRYGGLAVTADDAMTVDQLVDSLKALNLIPRHAQTFNVSAYAHRDGGWLWRLSWRAGERDLQIDRLLAGTDPVPDSLPFVVQTSDLIDPPECSGCGSVTIASGLGFKCLNCSAFMVAGVNAL